MCYTFIAINKRHNRELFSVVNKLISENIATNKDGFSIRIKTKKNDIIKRTINEKEFLDFVKENEDNINNCLFVHVHLRSATSGAVNEQNTHLWRIGSYYCSHNGIVSAFEQDGKMSDSFYFFNAIKEYFDNTEKLKEKLENDATGAYGVFLLSHTNKNKFVIFSLDKEIGIYTNNNYMVFTSNGNVVLDNCINARATNCLITIENEKVEFKKITQKVKVYYYYEWKRKAESKEIEDILSKSLNVNYSDVYCYFHNVKKLIKITIKREKGKDIKIIGKTKRVLKALKRFLSDKDIEKVKTAIDNAFNEKIDNAFNEKSYYTDFDYNFSDFDYNFW